MSVFEAMVQSIDEGIIVGSCWAQDMGQLAVISAVMSC